MTRIISIYTLAMESKPKELSPASALTVLEVL